MILFGRRNSKSIEERKLVLISQIHKINKAVTNMKWQDKFKNGNQSLEDKTASAGQMVRKKSYD